MIYADSSFLLRLISREIGSEAAVDAFRKLGRPRMAFTPLHEIEVRNGLRLKAFVEKKSLPARLRNRVEQDLAEWESRLDRFIKRSVFTPVDGKWSEATKRARELSKTHTLKLGTRAYDILHVGFALELHCRVFVTSDERQARLAKAAGMKTRLVNIDG